MIAAPPFDPARFRGVAPHYLTDRPDYAPGLAPRVAAACGLDGRGRLLDLGCGPGQLARAFAPYVESVLAVDPEPEMLALGRSLAAGLPVAFQEGSSADVSPAMGRFRLAAIGRAFHWMDREETARRLDALLEPGGALVLFRIDHLAVPANAWHARLEALTGPVTARAWDQPGWAPHEAVLLASPFAALERIGVVHAVRTPVAALLRRTFAMSAARRARLGEAGLAGLRAEVEAVLEAAAEDGVVSEVLESMALIARRA